MHRFEPILVPRRGLALVVLIIARISTVHQDLRSLADQIALCEQYVRDRYEGPIQCVHIQGRGSGEFLDRVELIEAESVVESGRFDLVIVEDIGRICRRNRAVDFCELCEDMDTRLIAINDNIDTANDDWRMNAFFASFKHESGNKDTAKRIRRTLRNRFVNGEVVQTFPYGYIKPPEAANDNDIRKDPDAERVYAEWFRRLEEGQYYSEVADWLNAQKVPPGRWARNAVWDGRMVARVTHNTILKGYRRRNERMSRRINKSGRRKSVKAPPCDLLLRHVPHLQFVEPARYDRLIAILAARHEECARGRTAGTPDTRAGVAKKRTVWPGQHVVCGVCGRLYYWGGHGQADHMMCAGAREYACWNAATFDGHESGRRLAAAVLKYAESLPEFDSVFRAKVEAAARASRITRDEDYRRLDREIGQSERDLANVIDAIMKIGYSAALQARLAETEGRKARLQAERADLDRHTLEIPKLPPIVELKGTARARVGCMAFDDPEFGRLMTKLVPKVEVHPYRLLDGGAIVLRAHATIDLAPLVGSSVVALDDLITRSVTIDLFDAPQRAAFREDVVRLRGTGMTERQVAKQLGLTLPPVQRAMSLQRKMIATGLCDPYVLRTSEPEGDGKCRRHLHPRYMFRPLEGYPAFRAHAA